MNVRGMTLMDMNFRVSPNGTKLDLIPKGERVTGEVRLSGSVGWLYTMYNGKSGCVAVLPESRGYAKEIISSQPDNPSEDYKELCEQAARAQTAGGVYPLVSLGYYIYSIIII